VVQRDSSGDLVTLTLPGNRPPWTATGLEVEAGDHISLLGSGFIRWSPTRDIGAGAKFHLWARVPGGEVVSCTQDTTTFVADRAGPLELCVYKGEWADRAGNLATGIGPYAANLGELEVTAVRWAPGVDPAEGLATLAHPLAPVERHRLAHPVTRPPGWQHLLAFGETDIFRAGEVAGRASIDVVCDDDAGILRTPVDWPLDELTTFEWAWKFDQLPSSVGEDTTWAHEYVSIALEFDSGRDLTWYWSAALEPVEATFDCPVRAWTARETHMPLRRGREGLGVWHHEQRRPWEDHLRFMGPPPARVVAVWLIGVSHFTRGLGRATFTDIRLSGPGGEHDVLARAADLVAQDG
jgi:hypothetical protein